MCQGVMVRIGAMGLVGVDERAAVQNMRKLLTGTSWVVVTEMV